MDKDLVSDAVKTFNERINQALTGDNAANDIQKAVWVMLKDLKIDVPQMSREE